MKVLGKTKIKTWLDGETIIIVVTNLRVIHPKAKEDSKRSARPIRRTRTSSDAYKEVAMKEEERERERERGTLQ